MLSNFLRLQYQMICRYILTTKPLSKKLPNRLADAEVAAAPYVLEDPLTHAPRLLMLFKEIAKGASATLVTHTIEPALVPAVSALPNLIQIAPVTPTTPPPRR